MSVNDDAKGRIQDSAAVLFAQYGVSATGLAEISQRACVSKGTLYYHYTTKDKLVYDVCELHMLHTMDIMYAWLDTIVEKCSIKDVLYELLDMLTNDVFRVKLHIALCSEAARGNESLRGLMKAKYNEMGLVIDLASIRMDMKIYSVPDLKQMFFSALDGLMLHALMGLDNINKRLLLEKIFA